VALQAAIVLAPAELLNDEFRRGVVHHLGDDACPLDEGLADARVFAILVQQDAVELEARPLLDVAVVQRDEVALADAILAGAVFKHCVHRSILIFCHEAKRLLYQDDARPARGQHGIGASPANALARILDTLSFRG